MRTNIGELIGLIQIRNVCRLPARNVQWFVKIKVVAGGDEKDFPIGDLEGDNVAAPGVVMRKGSFNIETINEIKKDNKKDWYFYVWGTVRYFDGFVAGRHTNFCHRYSWHSFSEIDHRLTAPATEACYHKRGNDAD